MFKFALWLILSASPTAKAIVGGFGVDSSSMTDDFRKMASHTVVLLNTQKPGSHSRCSGTLLTSNIILTAAHCIPKNLKDLWVVTSPYEFAVMERHAVLDAIKDRPASLPTSEDIDLALVKFAGKLPNGYSPTSWVTSFNAPQIPFYLSVVGYGETFSGTNDAGELRFGLALIYKWNVSAPTFMANQTNSQGVCHGDSGGPAYLKIADEYFVVGVVSAVVPLDMKGHAVADSCKGKSIFSSTIYFQNWIASNLKNLK